MKYLISRNLQEYGPYTLADLQRYVAAGSILLTDMCRSEGMSDWVPVSQVIGNIPVPVQPSAPAPQYGGAMQQNVYGGAPQNVYGGVPQSPYGAPAAGAYPDPPSMPWWAVMLIGFVTCGIFFYVWAFIQASWMKKVLPTTKAMFYYSLAIGALVGYYIVAFMMGVVQGISASRSSEASPVLGLIALPLILAYTVLWIIAIFNMKSCLEEHFNSAEPYGLKLSGVMTFFFNVLYFQYHLTRIVELKKMRQMGMASAGAYR